MKKQLLIAAVAATMTSVAFADISITGGSKINWTSTDTTGVNNSAAFKHDVDFTLVGKSGDTTVSATVSNASATATAAATMVAENVFMTTKVMNVNVKAGQYAGGDSNMGDGTRSAGKFSADTTLSGVKVQFEDSTAGSNSVTLSGSVAGVAISHEVHQNDNTDTSVSGSFGGVTAKYRSVDVDTETATARDKASLTLSTEVQGVTLSYAKVDVDGTAVTTSDDFFGTYNAASLGFNEAEGFSAKTAIAGNTVTVKSYDVKPTAAQADDSFTKLIVTRPLAAGATFEMTYTDKDAGNARPDVTTLDLELAVKF